MTKSVLLLASLVAVTAWNTMPARRHRGLHSRLFSMVDVGKDSTPAADSADYEIQSEIQSGTLLEGGKVMDFASVKASDQVERALEEAKIQLQNEEYSDAGGEILGINEDVVKQVGHTLGDFADAQQVQQVASWLRSKSDRFDENKRFTASEMASFDEILSKAYEESGEVTSAFAKTFYMGTALLGEEARKAIWAVYVWCRRTDEIVDAPRDDDTNQEMMRDLSRWEVRLQELWNEGKVVDVFDLCLLDIRIQYPQLDITPFMDMIRGMLMDVPDLGVERYETFDELHLYCYRVAGTVGLMSMPIFRCAPGFTDEQAREPALSLGVAFQLTNILRDIGEDAALRRRIYLPREDMLRFGVTEEQIYAQKLDENYVNMMKFQIERARDYYARARRGVYMLAPESRLPVQLSLDAYGRILDKIEENDYDSLTTRAYVDKWEKASMIPASWYKTLDISQSFPLFGDAPVRLDSTE